MTSFISGWVYAGAGAELPTPDPAQKKRMRPARARIEDEDEEEEEEEEEIDIDACRSRLLFREADKALLQRPVSGPESYDSVPGDDEWGLRPAPAPGQLCWPPPLPPQSQS